MVKWFHMRSIVFNLLLCCVVASSLAPTTAHAQIPKSTDAKALIVIKKMIGKGTVKRGVKVVPARASLILKVGDTVSAMNRSSIVIVFADGSEHTILQNTSVVIDDLTSVTQDGNVSLVSTLKMVRGKARFFFKPRESRKSSKVKTHNSTLGVRGTKFLVDNADMENTHVVVFSGRVAARNNKNPNEEVEIDPGEYSRIQADQLPSKPRVLSQEQLASVLGDNDEEESFYEETVRQEKEERASLTLEAALSPRLSLVADYLRDDGDDESGTGVAVHALFHSPFGLFALFGGNVLEYNRALLRTTTLTANLGYGFDWGWALQLRIFGGAGFRNMEDTGPEPVGNSDSTILDPTPSPPDQRVRWSERHSAPLSTFGVQARLPAQSFLAVLLSLEATRMINPEQHETLDLSIGVSLGL